MSFYQEEVEFGTTREVNNMDNKKGIDKARETAGKLRNEVEEKVDKETKTMDTIKNHLQSIAENKDLAEMYNNNSQVGAENLSGSSPTLSVFAAGKSQTRLADGTKPNDGYFYYKPTQEQFENLEVHILSISRGFYAKGMTQADGTTPMVFNQLVSGMFISEDEKLTPFIMYLTGKKLQPMWDFGKEANKYIHSKPFGIPMFALRLKLTTSEEKNNFGMSWVIKFEIMKNEDGSPILINDPEKFTFLKNAVESGQQVVENIIKAKAGEDTETETPVKEVDDVDPLDPDAIPF